MPLFERFLLICLFKWRMNSTRRKMMGNLQKITSRKLHTIISRETIKPSSPTPSHLQTYNLSLIDQCSHHAYIPGIFFYPNHSTSYNKAHHLKKSLSQTLNQYYPFAGRFPTPRPTYINCNDDGITFLEALNDSEMQDVVHFMEQDKAVRSQLFADGLEWHSTDNSLSPLAAQFNHFSCGGTAVAVSMSHKIGDACTLATFMNHWATGARSLELGDKQQVLPFNAHFISSPTTNFTVKLSHLYHTNGERVVKRFVFSNSKLCELKNKVRAMAERAGTPLNNLTRFEVLTSLLYKTGMAADAAKSNSSGPSYMFIVVDMRVKMAEKLPETTVGNILSNFLIITTNPNEIELHTIVAEIKKGKSELEVAQNLQDAIQTFRALESKMENEDLDYVARKSYSASSLCRFPFKKVDFGWGKPVRASIPMGSIDRNTFVLMETPDGDGIEAQVTLEREHMHIFQNDKELLTFSSDA